jgi:GNAT superfamily N-acetyltransferase
LHGVVFDIFGWEPQLRDGESVWMPMTDLSHTSNQIGRFGRSNSAMRRRLIESVWHEYFHQHLDPFVRDFIYTRLSDVDSAEAAYGDRALFLCAIAEGEIVGTGAIKRLDNRECEMVRMFVASAYRSRGIGWTIVARRMG